jgi:hypothetical protein
LSLVASAWLAPGSLAVHVCLRGLPTKKNPQTHPPPCGQRMSNCGPAAERERTTCCRRVSGRAGDLRPSLIDLGQLHPQLRKLLLAPASASTSSCAMPREPENGLRRGLRARLRRGRRLRCRGGEASVSRLQPSAAPQQEEAPRRGPPPSTYGPAKLRG